MSRSRWCIDNNFCCRCGNSSKLKNSLGVFNMKTTFIAAALACLTFSGAAMANNITIDAGVLPISPSTPYGHLFVHDASPFTDTIDFYVSTAGLGTSANLLNVQFNGLDIFNITGLSYSVWGGTTAASTTNFYGTYAGNNTTNNIGSILPGAYHLVINGLSNGTNGGAYGVALVSGVPEPESVAMMLAGLGLLGLVKRRKQAKAAKLAA